MLFFADDEQDKDLDNDEDGEDADADKDSDEEGDDSEDEDAGDDDSEDADDSDEDEDAEDEDDKPVTRKELKEMLKGRSNKTNANRRVSQKDKGRNNKQPSEADKRLDVLEKQSKETALLERKRSFGYENSLSPKQVNHVFRLTKRPTTKFLAQPHVKAALEAIGSQEKVARNTPSGSGKKFRTPDGKKWTDLKPEERQSSLADRRRSILENKR